MLSSVPSSDSIAASLPSGTTAIVYCEGQFGQQDGKTANGLVRHSERYEILSVIDSTRAMLVNMNVNLLPAVGSRLPRRASV